MIKLDRKLFKTYKKIEELIDFSYDYSSLKKYKILQHHNKKSKLIVKQNVYSDRDVYYDGVHLFSIKFNNEPNNKFLINKDVIELTDATDDEFFNLSLTYDTYIINLMKIVTKLNIKNTIQNRSILGIYTLNYELICNACNAIKTQYEKVL